MTDNTQHSETVDAVERPVLADVIEQSIRQHVAGTRMLHAHEVARLTGLIAGPVAADVQAWLDDQLDG